MQKLIKKLKKEFLDGIGKPEEDITEADTNDIKRFASEKCRSDQKIKKAFDRGPDGIPAYDNLYDDLADEFKLRQ